LFSEKEVRSMMKADSGLVNTVIERILELSADAQIDDFDTLIWPHSIL
jgi:hypothetical protein